MFGPTHASSSITLREFFWKREIVCFPWLTVLHIYDFGRISSFCPTYRMFCHLRVHAFKFSRATSRERERRPNQEQPGCKSELWLLKRDRLNFDEKLEPQNCFLSCWLTEPAENIYYHVKPAKAPVFDGGPACVRTCDKHVTSPSNRGVNEGNSSLCVVQG